MHSDHAPTVPPTFHLLGSTTRCRNQGMIRFHDTSQSPAAFSLSDIHVLTTQGHPEFTKSISTLIIKARVAGGKYSKETGEDARRREDWRNDGIGIFGKVIWHVLGTGSA